MVITKKRKALIIFVIMLIFVAVTVILYKSYFSISFEKIYECNADIPEENDLYWFTQRDASYDGFFGTNNDWIYNLVDKSVDIESMHFDYNNYTYVITIDHELKKISYSYSDMKNRKFLFIPKQFVGNVVLDSKETNKLYIYRIKKMDIDCDYHNPDYGVSFVD